MALPKKLRPVLAKIRAITELGVSEYYEVVYYDDFIDNKWCSFAGSKTFNDGEFVITWRYADECLDSCIVGEQQLINT